MGINSLVNLDDMVEPILGAARIPGAAIAVVADGECVLARGYGCRDLESRLPMTPETQYPIASTTKALNATILGMLVEEGRLSWDAPVRSYMPELQLWDALTSDRVTLRDLVTMRTGLPRHDWLWEENPIGRRELVERVRYLEPSAGLRERFQYNNLTATMAGYVAEIVSGRRWEELLRERILDPLKMHSTRSGREGENLTSSYHENRARELILTEGAVSEATAPSGGTVHSCVVDMARWMIFNLSSARGSSVEGIAPEVLREIHSPQMVAGTDPAAPTENSIYAMGWFIDTYNGRPRLSHGGNLNGVNSEVSLFPQEGIGIVSFINFGCTSLARVVNQCAMDLILGMNPSMAYKSKLEQYERRVEDSRRRNEAVRRVGNTRPSHDLSDYKGHYVHPAYGVVEIQQRHGELIFQRGNLMLALEHWHYDAWVARECDRFRIDVPHAFDRTGRIMFETGEDGEIVALTIRLEPAVGPIRFRKQQLD